MQLDADVIVVGAGPVGLWLAAEARLAGAQVCVVERRTELVKQSRALTLHGRTLECFGLRGLGPEFLNLGKRLGDGHFGALDTRLDFSVFDSPFPYALFLPQSHTEQLLEQHAVQMGVHIERGAAVADVQFDADSVTATVEDGRSLTARYLVGADGARSAVRRSAAIEFTGLPATDSIAMGDVILDLPRGATTWSGSNEHGGGTILPAGDGLHSRVIVLDNARRAVAQSVPLTLRELASSCRRTLGSDFGMRDPQWLTRFTNETRIAERYRHGRVLLVGDAAHIHAPMGGQGLNVGIQDAMNLGWKLGAVATGHAPDALLDTYHSERHPVGQRLFTNTVAQYQLVSQFTTAHRYLREVISDILSVGDANRAMAGEVSGFSVDYARPLLSNSTDTPLAGARMPDVELAVHGDDHATSVHRLLQRGHWIRLRTPECAATPLPVWLDPTTVLDVVGTPTRRSILDGVGSAVLRPDGHVDSATLTSNHVAPASSQTAPQS